MYVAEFTLHAKPGHYAERSRTSTPGSRPISSPTMRSSKACWSSATKAAAS
jgi:hypothetical protein